MMLSVAVKPTELAFAIHDTAIKVRGHDETQLKAVQTLWQQLFVLAEQNSTLAKEVKLELVATDFTPPLGELVYQARNLLIRRTKTGFYLSCGASQLQLFTQEGLAYSYLDASFWFESAYNQREFFLLSLLMLIRSKGLFGLHACGLKKDYKGLLMVGQSGSGKTTTTLNLIKSGWQFLSDDAVLLYEQDDLVKARAFRKGFSVMPDVAQELRGLDCRFEFDDPEGKKVIHLEKTYGGGFTATCTPNLIVFPKRSDHSKTDLLPLNALQSLLLLSQQSGGIMTEKNVSQQQLNVLKKMLERAHCFELRLAKDALENPKLVHDLLEAAA